MARLAVDGSKSIYFEDLGAGDTALVLIHGWGMSGRCWDGILKPLLEHGLRVVTMDHRGCGRSDHDFADLSIDAIAGDVAALVDECNLKSVILNGWSLGGAVATKAASLLGSRCSALVLTAGASPIYTQKPDLPLGGTAEDVAGVVAAMDDDRVTFLAGLAHAVCAKPISDAMLTWMGDAFIASAARASSTLGELAHIDQREMLLGLDMPVLSYICGQDGFVAPEISRWVADNHPRAKGIEFPDSGHAPFIEERADYVSTLVEFARAV
jgi:pimeloyl-[acyl-carrier protein] methyl ester esterase